MLAGKRILLIIGGGIAAYKSLDLIRRLRTAGYDMVYDFQNNDRTAQYFLGLTGKKPLWSGSAKGSSHQHMNEHRGEMHNFDRLAEQLLHAGLSPKPPGDPTGWIIGQDILPSLDWIRPAFRDPPRFQPEFFSLHGPYMLLIPGSSADHPEKRWPVDRFAKIATWVADAGITPVVIGTKAEGDIGTQIMKMEPRTRSLIGRTDLFQLATLSERAVFALGGDTGPMHLAAAARTPGVCLFAQEWNDDMARDLQSVWNPRTRLGRAAPRGVDAVGRSMRANAPAPRVSNGGSSDEEDRRDPTRGGGASSLHPGCATRSPARSRNIQEEGCLVALRVSRAAALLYQTSFIGFVGR